MYKELIKRYLSYQETHIECISLESGNKLVVEVELGSLGQVVSINHYEGKTFQDIFMEYFAESIIENIDWYDYLLTDYCFLAHDLVKAKNYDDDHFEYIKYVAEWYKDHNEGVPACYDEWCSNENA